MIRADESPNALRRDGGLHRLYLARSAPEAEMPNSKHRGHNPPDGADLNLGLVRSGGAEGRRSIIRKE